ncbi:MAG: GNAT family N-acetyltransferase [Spirochaetaceae bacterium]|nr:GNAT family N-acetyltransferase [Spirochaetaceae bacterium]MDT8296856.1 GNAT family N-acetyltransferase [Spirochaetaceae bacterium]
MQQPGIIQALTPEIEERIRNNPLLNIDTFIIPSPYISDPSARKDPDHSYVWIDEGEILGYLLCYSSADGKEFLIYKLVTSPYGRGRGIGTEFLVHLAGMIPPESEVYLYVWEKQHETVEFFRNKGFDPKDSIVYRNMVYHRLSAKREAVLEKVGGEQKRAPAADEIGRTRHDARKTLRSLTAMVNALAPENAGRIIEDINRETTTLVNMLNMYRDSMAMAHEVNLQDLILERLVPYVETSKEKVELAINLSASKPVVLGHWLNIGRALVNLASNALDAMAETDRPSRLTISLEDSGESDVLLRIRDNGIGIPEELLLPGEDGKPLFIGRSTKGTGKGEGIGTAQIWSTFGSERLNIASRMGEGTEWSICFERSALGLTKRFSSLQRRFHELQGLHEEIEITEKSPRTDIITAIWQVRKREIFLYELLERFSRHHNIRDLYRTVLAYFQGSLSEKEFESQVSEWKGEHPALNAWLSVTARRVCRRHEQLASQVDLAAFRGALFKSYGQSLEKVIIFTLNPATSEFLATDRKLAEHLDFVPYLGPDKDRMLRGEFVGDVNIDSNPIYLGVWSVNSQDDLLDKLRLLRDGVRTILDYGIHPEKKLSLYQTTYVRHSRDVDSDALTTFGEFSQMDDEEILARFARDADDEMQGFLAALD